MAFGHWLRENAERYLLEAANDQMMSQYPEACAKPYREGGIIPFFWRNFFVPVYLIIPWNIRRKIILYTSYPGGKRPHWKKYN
ncbi:MAG: hypothetical protein ACHQ6U_02825 [Thermodesulfobacteriota bacterium]